MQEVELTPEQVKYWDDTRAALVWSQPAFTHILFTMLTQTAPDGSRKIAYFTRDVPIAATDGSRLLLNPDTFFADVTLMERVFIVAHEIMHCVWQHCQKIPHFAKAGVSYPSGKSLPYDGETMNKAADYVINDLLIKSGVGSFPTIGLHDTTIGVSTDSAEDVYRKIYDDSGKGKGKGPGGFDQLQAPPQNAPQASPQAWKAAVAGALQTAKATGKLPKELERVLGEIVEGTVSWTEYIQGVFARKLGSGGNDWRRADRKLLAQDIFSPARAGFGAKDIVVAIDTSGSIGQAELDVFFSEMRSLLEDVRPQRIFVMWCDAQVHKVDVIEDASDLHGLKPHGGGGTDFKPVFKEIDKIGLEVDALVYLTDGYGDFPSKEPSYPVIWGDITTDDMGKKYPFGDTVRVVLK